MPSKIKGETRTEFISRCIPICIKEGLSQKAAIGKCEGLATQYFSHSKKTVAWKKKGK